MRAETAQVISRSIAAAHLSSLKERALAHLFDAGAVLRRTEVLSKSLSCPAPWNFSWKSDYSPAPQILVTLTKIRLGVDRHTDA